MFRMALAAATMFVVCAGSAHAQDTDPASLDARCAMIGLGIAGTEAATPEQRSNGMVLAVYYIGRLQGRTPNIDLRAAFQRQAQTTPQDRLEGEGTRCTNEFRAVGQTLNAMNQAPAPTP